MTRCNFLLACSSVNHIIFVRDATKELLPTVKIYGSKNQLMKRKEVLELRASAYVAVCGTMPSSSKSGNDASGITSSKNISDISFTWSITTTTALSTTTTTTTTATNFANTASIAKDPATFKLASFTLTPGFTFDITVTAFINTNSHIFSTSSVFVSVIQGQIKALIKNGQYLTCRVDQKITIDASTSYDEDEHADEGEYEVAVDTNIHDDNKNLLYKWSCRRLATIDSDVSGDGSNSCVHNNRLQLQSNFDSSSLPLLNVIPNKEGIYIFDLMVIDKNDDSRYDTTSITLEIKSPAYPAVTLPSTNVMNMHSTKRLFIAATADIHNATEYYWTSSPSLIDSSYNTPTIVRISTVPYPYSHKCPLRLETSVLYPYTSYTFTSTVSYYNEDKTSSASITITTNGPPILGQLAVVPLNGVELMTQFDCTTSYWEDNDLPLSYSFGYYNMNGKRSTLQPQSASNGGNFVLPSMSNDINNVVDVQLYVDVSDFLGLTTSSNKFILVHPLISIVGNTNTESISSSRKLQSSLTTSSSF
tara:strand:- start:582 stop:2180 length:1599 start_codon:yes stop_codon:yes gene_type:complete